MNEDREFLDRVRQGLLKIEAAVSANENKWEECASTSRISSISDAISIAFYLEKIALDSRQFEIAGLCRYLYERCGELKHKDSAGSIKISKTSVNFKRNNAGDRMTPSDIGRLFSPRIHAAYVNLLLKELGLARQSDDGWIATDTGTIHAIQRSNRDGKKPYVIWKPSVLEFIEEALRTGSVKTLPNPWKQSGKRKIYDNLLNAD